MFTIDIPEAFNETILFLAYDESFPIVEELKKACMRPTNNVLFTKDAKLRHRLTDHEHVSE